MLLALAMVIKFWEHVLIIFLFFLKVLPFVFEKKNNFFFFCQLFPFGALLAGVVIWYRLRTLASWLISLFLRYINTKPVCN